MEFYSDVKNNQLQKNVRVQIANALQKFENKRVKITIEKLKSKRSLNQNAFYHGYFILSQKDCFLERWGEIYLPHQIHTWNCANIWCNEKVDTKTGEIYKMPDSSTKPTKSEFEERLEMCRQFFRKNFDWELPYPNENFELNFNK